MNVPDAINQYRIMGNWDVLNGKIVIMVSNFSSNSSFTIYSIIQMEQIKQPF